MSIKNILFKVTVLPILLAISPTFTKFIIFKYTSIFANRGHANAQYNLGTLYQVGQGVPQNYKEAVKWFRKAAIQGNDSAQYNLGVMYQKRQGVDQNYEKAFEWFSKAAIKGIDTAQFNLGLMYQKG
jgi:TPR repeat protein